MSAAAMKNTRSHAVSMTDYRDGTFVECLDAAAIRAALAAEPTPENSVPVTRETLAMVLRVAVDGNGRRIHPDLTVATARTEADAIFAALAAEVQRLNDTQQTRRASRE
jgi:hypothetical protein